MNNLEIIRPGAKVWRTICGVDFGAHMDCLAYNDRYALLYVPGRTTYVCRMGQTHVYSPTEIMIFDRQLGWRVKDLGVLASGGRWNLKRVQTFKAQIDTAFGEGTTDALEWGATLVLATNPAWFKIIDPAVWTAKEEQKKRNREWREQRKERRRAELEARFGKRT